MASATARTVLLRLVEGVIALALVTGAFLVILFSLGLIFPTGTDLRSLMRGEDSGQIRVAGEDDDPGGPGPGGRVIATLTHLYRTVRDKPADTVAWKDSASGIRLRNRHAVRTLGRSGATISFDRGGRLELGENSLIILKDLGPSSDAGTRRASLVVLEGVLNATFTGGGLQLDLATPSGGARLIGQGGTDVRMILNPDGTTTYSVLGGRAELEADGQRLRLGSNHAVTMGPNGRVGRVVKLPNRPAAVSPGHEAVLTFRTTPPRVPFAWQQGQQADSSRIAIGRDPRLQEIVYAQETEGTEFTHGNLRAGEYYWTVTDIKGRLESPESAPRRLTLVQDTAAPELRVEFPEGPVLADRVRLSGTTEKGVRVFVGDTSATVGDGGRFEHELALARGLNVVVVEAVDDAGNSTFRSQVIEARF